MPNSPTTTETTCIRCGRPVVTETVQVYRYSFPADRVCSGCREIEHAENDQRTADTLFAQARIPRNYRSCSFATFKQLNGTATAFKLAQDWSRDLRRGPKPPRGLLLQGTSGVGKTHLAVSIIREASYAKIPSLFVNVPEWLNSLKDSWEGGAPVLSPREFTLLVIDDLGAEQGTDWSRDQLYSLINHRQTNHLATIVTSNLMVGELRDRLGSPTVSRLTSLCAPLEITSTVDYRAKLAGDE
jgi:DNA replication protein DnaC